MRELVLNDASITAPSKHTAINWLTGIAKGMSLLVVEQVVQNTLRTSRPLQNIHYLDDSSLWEVILAMQRDEREFLMRSIAKSPLTNSNKVSRIGSAFVKDGRELPPPIVLSAISDGIAVSFPSEEIWDRDLIEVKFYELIDDERGEVSEEETFEEINNLARSNHALPICERHRQRLRHQIKSYAELWNNRKQAFPDLLFGPDVEDHLKELNAGHLETIIGKLAALNAAAADWRNVGGGALPQWGTLVTNESESLQNHPMYVAQRQFIAYDGTRQLFLWHARFGNAGRVHLRFHPESFNIEIGYIGRHLPLP